MKGAKPSDPMIDGSSITNAQADEIVSSMLPAVTTSAVIDPGSVTNRVRVIGRGGAPSRGRKPPPSRAKIGPSKKAGRKALIGPKAPRKLSGRQWRADKRVAGAHGLQVCFSMPVEDFVQMCDLARHLGVSRSQLVRDLVRARHALVPWKEAPCP